MGLWGGREGLCWLSPRQGPQLWEEGSREDRCPCAWSLANLGSLFLRQCLAVGLTGAGHGGDRPDGTATAF